VDGSEFLQTLHLPKTQHRPFSSPKRLVRRLNGPGFTGSYARIWVMAEILRRRIVAGVKASQNLTSSDTP